jgi:hypothetical protein
VQPISYVYSAFGVDRVVREREIISIKVSEIIGAIGRISRDVDSECYTYLISNREG